MTRDEAIISIEEIKDFYGNKNKDGYDLEFVALGKEEIEALDMAIEALQQDPVTYTFDVKSDKCEECAYKKTVEELSKGFEDYIIHGERREP